MKEKSIHIILGILFIPILILAFFYDFIYFVGPKIYHDYNFQFWYVSLLILITNLDVIIYVLLINQRSKRMLLICKLSFFIFYALFLPVLIYRIINPDGGM